MREGVKTCPDCGALITPQLTNCRQCGRYLHGTRLEGFVFQNLLPESLRGSPGTGVIILSCLLYYVLMAMLAGFENLPGFTSFSLRALGGLSLPGILRDQYWRFVTSMFSHADLIHIAFNMYALSIAGRLVEEAFDKKQMLIMYLLSGVLGMVASYVWHVVFLAGGLNTVGASGAVCGMIGAAMVAGHRMGPPGEQVKKVMIRWGVYLLLFGFVVSGIDNAAHIGGFAVGAGLAYVFPLGLTQSVGANRALSVVVLGMLAGVLACVGLMLNDVRTYYPPSLDDDVDPRTVFFFTYAEGTPFDSSSQRMLMQNCEEAVKKAPKSEDTERRCERALRANPYTAHLYTLAASVYEARGKQEKADEIREALAGLERIARRHSS